MINWTQIKKLQEIADKGESNVRDFLKRELWYDEPAKGDLGSSEILRDNQSFEKRALIGGDQLVRIVIYRYSKGLDLKTWTPLSSKIELLSANLPELSNRVKSPLLVETYNIEIAQKLLTELKNAGFKFEKKFTFQRETPFPYASLNPENIKWNFSYDCEYYKFENGQRLIFMKMEDKNTPKTNHENWFSFIFFSIDFLDKTYINSMDNLSKQQFLIQKKQELAALEMQYTNAEKPKDGCSLIVIVAILGIVLTAGASAIDPFLGLCAIVLALIIGISVTIGTYSKKSKDQKKLDDLSGKILAVKNVIIEIENS